MKIIALIPARMNSSRFPGKPLALIHGKPMIEHIFRRATMCRLLDKVYVATCDIEISNAVSRFSDRIVMTSPAHERATERVAEAAEKLSADIIVMIQGDEPMITPEMIKRAVRPMLEDSTIECVNLVRRIDRREDFVDRNTIKVVMNTKQEAIYFSRSPIPSAEFALNSGIDFYKQVCVIPFRRDFLRRFAALLPTPLERAESIDMLRIIEHGGKIRLVESETETQAVDTPEDLRKVAAMMENDPLIPMYETGASK